MVEMMLKMYGRARTKCVAADIFRPMNDRLQAYEQLSLGQ